MSSDKIKNAYESKVFFKLLTFVTLLWRRLTSSLAPCVQRSIISAIRKLGTFVNWVIEENNTCMMSLMPANKTNTCINTGFCLLFNCILHAYSLPAVVIIFLILVAVTLNTFLTNSCIGIFLQLRPDQNNP